MSRGSRAEALRQHLAWWGLRHVTSDREYFAWQRRELSPAQLTQLAHHAERKRSGDAADEVTFYDFSADLAILPILYSQRYDYYEAIAPRIAARIEPAGTVLDFGCGVGILTTFYAGQFPNVRFVGVDRSRASIAAARERAHALGLANIEFVCLDPTGQPSRETYNLIVATHALVQAEQDPGLPSRDWRTFERAHDPRQQDAFEARTGVGGRLDALCASLARDGRLLLFEKTRQLARRIPFQRALAARELCLNEPPEPVRYRTVEEVSDDGPLFVLRKGGPRTLGWDESPERDEGLPFERAAVRRASSGDPDEPLYENHWPSAQQAWEQLQGRTILSETTRSEPDGRQMHVELGTAERFSYLYCANTFDQRQLVVVDPARRRVLDAYFQEIIEHNS